MKTVSHIVLVTAGTFLTSLIVSNRQKNRIHFENKCKLKWMYSVFQILRDQEVDESHDLVGGVCPLTLTCTTPC